jgi:FixJ family two-component response regulator
MSAAKPPVIAIVDDDESVRRATNMLMVSLGYEAHVFASAEKFLQSPRARDTSCLILDVQMPQMTGIELQAVLRERGWDIPVIFITAFPSDDIAARATSAGAACFLVKPFKTQALIDCIDGALRRRHRETTGPR